MSSVYLDGLGEVGGVLYGVSFAGSGGATSSSLYTINAANGALTTVGTTSVPIWEMGSTATGLYGLGQNYQNLYSIDPKTGATTLIGPLGVGTQTTGGLSVGANGLYYMVSGPGSSSLYAINTTTGAATLVGISSPGVCLKSMAYEDGTLYDASGYCFTGSKTFTLDPTNGASHFLANVVGFGDLNGMEPVPSASASPEPGTMALAGIITVFLWRRGRLSLVRKQS